MYILWQSFNPVIVVAYFTMVILFGVFFVLNLFLAVISDNFQKVSEENEKKDKE